MLSIIIPAYNEEENITRTILVTESVMNTYFPSNFEIIVVDDGSTDNTFNKVRKLSQKSPNIRGVKIPQNWGKGNALLKGFKISKGEILVFLDADLEFHPKNIPIYLKCMNELNADIIISSKRHPLSKIRFPLFRRIVSYYYNIFVRLLFGLSIHDTQAGFKLVRRNVFEILSKKFCAKRYAFDLEFLVVADQYGFKTIEAPIILKCRRLNSRIGLRSIISIFVDTWAIFYRLYVKRYYITIPSLKLRSRLKSFFSQTSEWFQHKSAFVYSHSQMPLKNAHLNCTLEGSDKMEESTPMASVIVPIKKAHKTTQDGSGSLQEDKNSKDL